MKRTLVVLIQPNEEKRKDWYWFCKPKFIGWELSPKICNDGDGNYCRIKWVLDEY